MGLFTASLMRPCGWAIPIALAGLLYAGCDDKRNEILSWSAYSELDVRWPYVLRLDHHRDGALLYCGAAHTSDPSDPQLEQIESLWAEFLPDLAFNEGGDPPTEKDRSAAIRKYGEPGLIRYLAGRDNVPVRSLDPSHEAEAAALIEQFGKLYVKMFYLLRSAAQYGRFETGRTLEAEMARLLEYYGRIPGLEGPPHSVEEIRVTLDQLIANNRGLKATDPSWFDPTKSDNLFNDVSRYSSEYRDRFMVDLLVGEVLQGKKVFAVVGGSHVVMQEPALRSALR